MAPGVIRITCSDQSGRRVSMTLPRRFCVCHGQAV